MLDNLTVATTTVLHLLLHICSAEDQYKTIIFSQD